MVVAPALDSIEVSCIAASTGHTAADLLCVPIFDGSGSERLRELDHATGGELERGRACGELQGTFGQLFVAPILARRAEWRRVALIGAGSREELETLRVRRIGTSAGLLARRHRARSLAIDARELTADPVAIEALVDGVLMARFECGRYKTGHPVPNIESVQILVDGAFEAVQHALTRGQTIARYCNAARELVNEPPNLLPPRVLAARASALAEEAGIAVEVLDEHAIARLNLRLLLAVASGSTEPPRLVVLRYEPPDAPPSPVIGLVGKGITFDGGGLSERRPEDLELMKYDMAGGAAVIGALCACGVLRPNVRCIGVVPATENMPDGAAMRPGDVVLSAAGHSVEIVDPDAEGRLVLADALWYARSLGATHLVDVATLTGGCVIALGEFASGLFGSPDVWVERVREAADEAGEPTCRLPLPADLPQALHSDVADIANRSRVLGGPIAAAAFLRTFTRDGPWAHLDIAGTAWTDMSTGYQVPGPTGVGVRTLVRLVTSLG